VFSQSLAVVEVRLARHLVSACAVVAFIWIAGAVTVEANVHYSLRISLSTTSPLDPSSSTTMGIWPMAWVEQLRQGS
jgi:hypothetical protein